MIQIFVRNRNYPYSKVLIFSVSPKAYIYVSCLIALLHNSFVS